MTHRAADRGAFKTPTLREVARTAPYMHDGSLSTLQASSSSTIAAGVGNPGLDAGIRPLHLSAVEKSDLVALLQSLSGTIRHGTVASARWLLPNSPACNFLRAAL